MRALQTFALENCSQDYVDEQFYNLAMKTNQLYWLDYYHSRVTHNPVYSKNFQQEYKELYYFTSSKNQKLFLISCNNFLQKEEGIYILTNTTESIEQSNFLDKFRFNATVTAFLNKIEHNSNYKIFLYLFGFTFLKANLITLHEKLKSVIINLKDRKITTLNKLFDYLKIKTYLRTSLWNQFKSILSYVLEK